VMNFGYGYEVRRRGFLAPAAGKTGTSHDVWFAGYTSNLLCIVWIGNDDYSDIKMSGALAASPIWAEFMKRAVQLPEYSDTKDFVPPSGVVQVRLDKVTNLLSDEACPEAYSAAFLDGTQPTDTCDHPNLDQRNIFQKLFGLGEKPNGPNLPGGVMPSVRQATPTPVQPAPVPGVTAQNNTIPPTVEQQPKKKKGFFSRIFGGGKDDSDNQKKKPDPNNPPQ
jgi:penicillin-binding protein 1B